MGSRTLWGSLLLLALWAPGSSVAVEAPSGELPVGPSGFLGDYSNLTPSPDHKHMLVYRLREQVLAGYDEFVVDPRVVLVDAEGSSEEIDPDDLKMLSDFLHEKLVEALEKGGRYRVLDEPGPGVARVRVAITEVVPIDPAKNVATKAAGAVLGVGLLVPRVDLGRASIEAEIIDSASGERLVAVVATREAHRFGGVVKGSKEWGDVKAAFKQWAKRFRKKLDRAHQR